MAYAKVENGIVVQLFDDADLTPVQKCEYPNCSHPVAIGWLFDGNTFTPPQLSAAEAPSEE